MSTSTAASAAASQSSSRTGAPLSPSSPLRPAKQRTGAGPVGWVGPLLAALLTLLGLVLLRDGVFAPAGATGWPGHQRSWLTTATATFDGLARARWMVAVGAVLVLLGLYLLSVALRRRTRRVLALSGASGAYLLPADVACRAASAADQVDGVLHVSAAATRRRVTVHITSTGGGRGASDEIGQQVSSAVSASLSALTSPPTVGVKTTSTDSEDSASPKRSKDLA